MDEMQSDPIQRKARARAIVLAIVAFAIYLGYIGLGALKVWLGYV
jgi:uncharacterized membrane protein (DUF485 family)